MIDKGSGAASATNGWSMLVEPFPGCSHVIVGSSADALKRDAADEWRPARGAYGKATFTIYSPSGVPFQTCNRVRGGSGRAVWEHVPSTQSTESVNA